MKLPVKTKQTEVIAVRIPLEWKEILQRNNIDYSKVLKETLKSMVKKLEKG